MSTAMRKERTRMVDRAIESLDKDAPGDCWAPSEGCHCSFMGQRRVLSCMVGVILRYPYQLFVVALAKD